MEEIDQTLPEYDFKETEADKLLLEIKGKNVTIDNLATKIKALEILLNSSKDQRDALLLENKRLKKCIEQINDITTGGPNE